MTIASSGEAVPAGRGATKLGRVQWPECSAKNSCERARCDEVYLVAQNFLGSPHPLFLQVLILKGLSLCKSFIFSRCKRLRKC